MVFFPLSRKTQYHFFMTFFHWMIAKKKRRKNILCANFFCCIVSFHVLVCFILICLSLLTDFCICSSGSFLCLNCHSENDNLWQKIWNNVSSSLYVVYDMLMRPLFYWEAISSAFKLWFPLNNDSIYEKACCSISSIHLVYQI